MAGTGRVCGCQKAVGSSPDSCEAFGRGRACCVGPQVTLPGARQARAGPDGLRYLSSGRGLGRRKRTAGACWAFSEAARQIRYSGLLGWPAEERWWVGRSVRRARG